MALNFQPYDDAAGRETRRRWSLDGIFNNYLASRDRARAETRQNIYDSERASDRAGAESDRLFREYADKGFDPRNPTAPNPWARGTPSDSIGPTQDRSAMVGAPENRGTVGTVSSQPGQGQAEVRSTPQNTPWDPMRAAQEYVARKARERSLGMRKMEGDVANTEADTAAKMALAEKTRREASMAPGTDGKAENELRDEVNRLSGPFIQVRDSLGRIRAAANNPTAAGDLALIFNYMKVLDPGSTVREGEFATAQNSAGLPDRIRAKYNSVINGERLEAGQRADFVARAEELYSSQAAIQRQMEGEYRRIAKSRRANPDNVIIDRSLPAQNPGNTPEQIRADFQAGRITREQARAAVAAIRGGNLAR